MHLDLREVFKIKLTGIIYRCMNNIIHHEEYRLNNLVQNYILDINHLGIVSSHMLCLK